MVKVAPTNVMEFVRAADVYAVGMASEYKFLCDAAHPTFHPSFHLLLAGAMYDNWTNDTFARAMHPVLDRTLKAAEAALGGIERVGSDIAALCLPAISQEVSTWPLEA